MINSNDKNSNNIISIQDSQAKPKRLSDEIKIPITTSAKTKFSQSVLLKQSPVFSRAILWAIVGVTTSVVVWANVAKFEEAISSQGKLEPQGTVKEVQTPINGLVKTVYVKDGARVKKGDLLLQLDTTTAKAQNTSLEKIRAALIQENQFYQSQLRGEDIADIISSQRNNIGDKIPIAIPPQMISLSKSRSTIAAENRLYRAQLNGSENASTNNRLSPEEKTRLNARISELNSRLNNLRFQGQQAEQKLKENQVQLANSLNLLPATKQALLLSKERLKNNENALKIDQQKLAVNSTNLKISGDIVQSLESITKEGAFPVLQLRRQQQDFLNQQQNFLTQNQQILQREQQIIQLQQQILEQQNNIKNTESQGKQFAEEEKRLVFEIAQLQEQFRNAAAASAEDLFSKITANDKNLAEIDSQISKAIIDNDKRIAEIDSQLSQAKVTLQYQEVRSSSDGIIFDLKATSPGYVANPSQPILKIVPEDDLTAKIYITNKDIGFVKEGMKVDVRIDSFPFSEFGDVKGEIIWIGSDALPPEEARPYYSFPAKIRLDKQSLIIRDRPVKLQSGMSVTTNVRVRSRTVMSIFTDLFVKQIDSLRNVR
jgi:hemolysin D